MRYFPKKLAKGRVPDREYFFNVLNTFQSDYLQSIVKHANDQRNSVANESIANEAIEITDDWWNALNCNAFTSCKSPILGTLTCIFFYSWAERKGRTIHLLKASSKKVPQERKRRKIDLLGTFDEFQAQLEEQKQEEAKSQAEEKVVANHEN